MAAFRNLNLLPWMIFFVLASFLTEMRIEGLSTDVCIDIGDEEMTCTREVLETRTLYDSVSINVGVTQRIDGSDAEKQAVRDVLKHMDNYFFHEVLALPEYDYARSRCKNSNELCAFWSSVGECESNRVFMLTNCPAACRFCLLLHSGLAS
eukprot:CAMPEP_0116129276 /NCGR_PEP_ID=MMETSP0329-20121206/7840_1 /TAXON_ID=697910 /ORGANISM="Pseudo-nitzschia arenysensis, Strain B593" /LENGTH=150 /DNA_ID=CAMNT_0003623537 /DNA_START=140 /DNA_END=592 /DNA_ORIENTATION=+